jgi:hypothetical protein
MSWVESQLNDETVFPLQLGTAFPKTFQSTVKVIFKRLFRVYAHIYHSHFQKVRSPRMLQQAGVRTFQLYSFCSCSIVRFLSSRSCPSVPRRT